MKTVARVAFRDYLAGRTSANSPQSGPIYARVRAELEKPGRSQSGLAEHLGNLPRSTVSRALKNDKGLERHWPGVAIYLGVSLDWLIFGQGAPEGATGEIGSGVYRRVLNTQAEKIAEQQVIIEHLLAEYRQLTGHAAKLPGRDPGPDAATR